MSAGVTAFTQAEIDAGRALVAAARAKIAGVSDHQVISIAMQLVGSAAHEAGIDSADILIGAFRGTGTLIAISGAQNPEGVIASGLEGMRQSHAFAAGQLVHVRGPGGQA